MAPRGTMGRASVQDPSEGDGHAGARLVPRRDGRHTVGASACRDPRGEAGDPGQARDAEPRRVRQGSDRDPDDRGGRAGRAPQARRDDRRAHVRQHGSRARDRRGGPRLPLHLRDAGQDEPGEDLAPPRLRRRGRDLPDRRFARFPGELLPGGRPARRGDPRRLPAEPVPQPREPPDPLRDDRPGDLATDRGAAHGVRLRSGHRWHDLGRGPLPEGAEPGRPRGGGGPRGVALFGRLRPGPTSSKASARTSCPPRSIRRSWIATCVSRIGIRS